MTKFSKKLKKNLFLAHFPNFFGKKIFSENLAPSSTTSHGILAPCQISERTNDAIPRKLLDRWSNGRTEGQKDGETLFYRNLPATAGGPKSFDLCHYGSTPKSRVSHARR